MLSVIMLSVIMQSVVILNVMAPLTSLVGEGGKKIIFETSVG
jgi:hypothetical protein